MDGGLITENKAYGGYQQLGHGILSINDGIFILYQGEIYGNGQGNSNITLTCNVALLGNGYSSPGFGYWPAGTRGWVLEQTPDYALQTPYTNGQPPVPIPGLGVTGVAMPDFDTSPLAVYGLKP
jgi:hypothetical protein